MFFSEEKIHDFKCDTCKSAQNAVIKRTIVKLPHVLILQLKRYNYQEVIKTSRSTKIKPKTTFEMTKNKTEIQIPFHLSLNSFVVKKSTETTHKCIGIVNHLGNEPNSGHYTADIYNSNEQNWLNCDDSKVRVISQKEALENRTSTGYMFFYVKI